MDDKRAELCPVDVSVNVGRFNCHLCDVVIKGEKFVCMAVAKHMHRAHDVVCRGFALPCTECKFVSWTSNLVNHHKSKACMYYPKDYEREKYDHITFRGNRMPLATIQADYGFLTMKRSGEWACPKPDCKYRLFKDDYPNASLVTRYAAMHMLEEHRHLLEFYACYCYLCPGVTFAQATMSQHLNSHADHPAVKGFLHNLQTISEPNSLVAAPSQPDNNDDVADNDIKPSENVVVDASAPSTSSSSTSSLTETPSTAAKRQQGRPRRKTNSAKEDSVSSVPTTTSKTTTKSTSQLDSPMTKSQETASPLSMPLLTGAAAPKKIPVDLPEPTPLSAKGKADASCKDVSMETSTVATNHPASDPAETDAIESVVEETVATTPLPTASKNKRSRPSLAKTPATAVSAPKTPVGAGNAATRVAATAEGRPKPIDARLITTATEKITRALAVQTGNEVASSAEVGTAVKSLIHTLIEGGVLSEQAKEDDSKILQIEMDLPGHPGLVIQVPASLLVDSADSVTTLEAVAPAAPAPQQESQSRQNSLPQRGNPVATVPYTLANLNLSTLDFASLPIAHAETGATETAKTPSKPPPNAVSSTPRRQATMTGSILANPDGLTLMTSKGPITLPKGTRQVTSADGGVHIQLPPGLSLSDIGL